MHLPDVSPCLLNSQRETIEDRDNRFYCATDHFAPDHSAVHECLVDHFPVG